MLYQQVRVSQGGGTPIYIRGHAPGTVIPAARPGHSSVPATPGRGSRAPPRPSVSPACAGLLEFMRAVGLLSPR